MKYAVLALAALLARPAFAQENPPVFQESVEVRVMDLDVVVTDSQGRPVTDLSGPDFTVRIDGQPVPIDYFTRVDAGAIHAPDLASASPERVLAEYRKGEEAYVPRHFLVYVDSGHLSPGLRNRAIEALRDFVTRLGPTDTARLVLFDRRPHELTEWTTSKEALLSAIARMERGVGMSRLQTELQTLREVDSTRSRSSRAFLIRSYAQQERNEVDAMLSDMSAQLATLTPLPGKKAFLFVSGGFETQPGYAMANYAFGGASLTAFEIRSLGPQVEELARRANANEITFYTVDARGLEGSGGSASNDDPLAARPAVAFIARQGSQEGMVTLASQTGGIALVNSNDFQRGLSRVYQDASSYYSIGVNLSKLPGKGYRNVRVEVRRPGVTVRARRGYAPRSPEERAADIARAALKTNVAYKAFPVALRLAPATKEKKNYAQPITVTFPASALTFVRDGAESRANAEIYVGAMDDSGRTSDIGRQVASFNAPEGAASDATLTYPVTLQMRKGNFRVVVNVRDSATGRMGTAKADVRVE